MKGTANTSAGGSYCGRAVYGVSNLTSEDMHQITVMRQQARPVPWSHLARQFSVNENDLRMLFAPKDETKAASRSAPVRPSLSQKEARFRALWLSGAPKSEITEVMGMSVGAIDHMRERLGLQKRAKGQKPNEWRREDDAFILNNYIKGGMTAEAVGLAMGRTRTAVIGRAYRKGWTRAAMMSGGQTSSERNWNIDQSGEKIAA